MNYCSPYNPGSLVIELRNELDEAKERIRQLENELKAKIGSEMTFPPVMRLTGLETTILSVLMLNPIASHRRISSAIIQSRHERKDVPSDLMVKVKICHLRKKLAPFGVTIETLWGRGYMMSEMDKAKIVELINASGKTSH
jgi:two-component system cell cycle response regulator CtrA